MAGLDQLARPHGDRHQFGGVPVPAADELAIESARLDSFRSDLRRKTEEVGHGRQGAAYRHSWPHDSNEKHLNQEKAKNRLVEEELRQMRQNRLVSERRNRVSELEGQHLHSERRQVTVVQKDMRNPMHPAAWCCSHLRRQLTLRIVRAGRKTRL